MNETNISMGSGALQNTPPFKYKNRYMAEPTHTYSTQLYITYCAIIELWTLVVLKYWTNWNRQCKKQGKQNRYKIVYLLIL